MKTVRILLIGSMLASLGACGAISDAKKAVKAVKAIEALANSPAGNDLADAAGNIDAELAANSEASATGAAAAPLMAEADLDLEAVAAGCPEVSKTVVTNATNKVITITRTFGSACNTAKKSVSGTVKLVVTKFPADATRYTTLDRALVYTYSDPANVKASGALTIAAHNTILSSGAAGNVTDVVVIAADRSRTDATGKLKMHHIIGGKLNVLDTNGTTKANGTLTVQHMLAQFTATAVLTDLTRTKADCCHPTSGTNRVSWTEKDGTTKHDYTMTFSATCGGVSVHDNLNNKDSSITLPACDE